MGSRTIVSQVSGEAGVESDYAVWLSVTVDTSKMKDFWSALNGLDFSCLEYDPSGPAAAKLLQDIQSSPGVLRADWADMVFL